MEIKFRKGYSQSKNSLYYVDVTSDGDTVYAGFVFKSITGKWENSKGEEQYRTRREATDALTVSAHVELAAVRHYANATSTDVERSWGMGDIYRASKRVLLGTIALTYPDMDVTEVYEGWVESGDSIADVVERIRQERREFQAYLDAEHAEAMEEDAAREAARNGGVIDVVDNNHLIIVSYGTTLPIITDSAEQAYRFTTRDGLPAAMVAVDTRGYLIGADTASLLADMIAAAYTQVADTKSIPHTVSILA